MITEMEVFVSILHYDEVIYLLLVRKIHLPNVTIIPKEMFSSSNHHNDSKYELLFIEDIHGVVYGTIWSCLIPYIKGLQPGVTITYITQYSHILKIWPKMREET